MNVLAIHGGHNAAAATYVDGQYHAIEFERLFRQRYFFAHMLRTAQFAAVLQRVVDAMGTGFGVENRFDLCHAHVLPSHRAAVERVVHADRYNFDVRHHESHAACAFYQSPFDRALVVSFDGGGNDGAFNVYLCSRDGGPTRLRRLDTNLGTVYGMMGYPCRELTNDKTRHDAFLSFAGKMMGLCGYGKARSEWEAPIRTLYREYRHDSDEGAICALNRLGDEIGLSLGVNTISEPQDGYDLAATSQRAFEDVFFETAGPELAKYHDLPVCMVGGAALNVLLNERVRRAHPSPVFVPPNPDDGGLAAGMVLNTVRPREVAVLTHTGLPLTPDTTGRPFTTAGVPEIARMLADGQIVGVAHGRAEYGPRALGNRSILCDPSRACAKEILNARVKFREWFRPFAPVVREEDQSRYFEATAPSPFMSFAPPVRPEWRQRLAAITHVDGTARGQTVTAVQNPWVYGLLTEFDRLTGVGVLLNTSFNSKGRPILGTAAEALEVLDNTQIDAVWVEGRLYRRG